MPKTIALGGVATGSMNAQEAATVNGITSRPGAMLAERETRIHEALAQADKARLAAEAVVEENRTAMAKAQAEAQQAVAEGRAAAERVAQEMRQRAEAEAGQMLEQAQRTIRQERDQAILALRNQVAELAILAAGKVLDENQIRLSTPPQGERLPRADSNDVHARTHEPSERPA